MILGVLGWGSFKTPDLWFTWFDNCGWNTWQIQASCHQRLLDLCALHIGQLYKYIQTGVVSGRGSKCSREQLPIGLPRTAWSTGQISEFNNTVTIQPLIRGAMLTGTWDSLLYSDCLFILFKTIFLKKESVLLKKKNYKCVVIYMVVETNSKWKSSWYFSKSFLFYRIRIRKKKCCDL